MDFVTMMTLESHGPDTFVGIGPSYPWGGLYGGQIVAQGLRAAGMTVEPQFPVHSLHAYFIRRGDAAEPIRFEVDRVRNGRSFVTRRVVARQSVGAILAMEASFQVAEEGAAVQIAMLPDVAGPAPQEGWSTMFDRSFVRSGARGRVDMWARLRGPLPDESMLHACALAYVSDDVPTDAVVLTHPDYVEGDHDGMFMNASLDHAIWFHRQARADEWQLHDFVCHGLMSSRGLAIGHVFTETGTHVATVTQEVLLRRRR